MELKSSKIRNFLLGILCTIVQMPGGSETKPMFEALRADCGKTSVLDPGPGHANASRELPWVVAVIGKVGNEKYDCSGTIITPLLILTSMYCVPKEPQAARYEIHFDYGRKESVTKVHLVNKSELMLLEVSSPFRPDFTVCAFDLNVEKYNDTVWTASRVVETTGSAVTSSLHQEQWTLANATTVCKTLCKIVPSDRCTCALSSEVASNTCRGDEGKPVVRWDGNKWYLGGVVTDVYFPDGRCATYGHRERVYQKIIREDTFTIAKLILATESHYVITETEEPEPKPAPCGRAASLSLGSQNVLAPIYLPWIVGVRGTLGNRSWGCPGAILKYNQVLIVEQCYPESFRNAMYTVIHGSTDLSTGTKIGVKEVLDKTVYGPSFVILVLASRVEDKNKICAPGAPYFLKGKDVIAASWALEESEGPLTKNRLYYEKWTLPVNTKTCEGKPFNDRGSENEFRVCGIAGTDTPSACQGHLGQLVMHKMGGRWMLVGVVTSKVEQQECGVGESRKRIFEWLTRWSWESDTPTRLLQW